MPVKVLKHSIKLTDDLNHLKPDQTLKGKQDLAKKPKLDTNSKPTTKPQLVEKLKLKAKDTEDVKPKLFEDKHELVKKKGPVSERRQRCDGCIKMYESSHGTEYAMKFAKKVATYCKRCPNEPHLCTDCFKIEHEDETIVIT